MIEIAINDLENEKQAVLMFYKKQIEAFRRIKKQAEDAEWADAKYDEFVESMNLIGETLSELFQTITNGSDVYIISDLLSLAYKYLENEKKFPRI